MDYLFTEFDFEIVYRPGEKKTNASYMSRPVECKSIMIVLSVGLEDDLEQVYH